MQPSLKDFAEFFWYAIHYRLISYQAAVVWAEGLIAESDEPPIWLIDLGMAFHQQAVLEALRAVPGETTRHVSGILLSACLLHLLQRNRIGWKDAWLIGRGLAEFGLLPPDTAARERIYSSWSQYPAFLTTSSFLEEREWDWATLFGNDLDLEESHPLTDAEHRQSLIGYLSVHQESGSLLPLTVLSNVEAAGSDRSIATP